MLHQNHQDRSDVHKVTIHRRRPEFQGQARRFLRMAADPSYLEIIMSVKVASQQLAQKKITKQGWVKQKSL